MRRQPCSSRLRMPTESRCGYAAIVGEPNVGKSTLLNTLVGEKVSIVSDKPHTTRHKILGVLTRDSAQALFIDTPGLAPRGKRALHRLMNRAIQQAFEDADVTLFVTEATRPQLAGRIGELVSGRFDRTILVINKIDRLKARAELLPILQELASLPFAALVPVSAKTGENLDRLIGEIFERLPPGPMLYPADATTDRDVKFRIAEIVREKLLHLVHQEVPYGLTVEVEHLGKNEQGQWLVHALIWLEREGQKPIVIGKGGRILKEAGRAARLELRKLLGGRVHLELWVKVRKHWSDSDRELRRFGFDIQ
jgi:GTPase